MTIYTLTLNATQAAVVSHACEVLSRLGMGQYTDALECLPTKELCPDGWHEDMQAIGHILSKHAYVYGLRYSQKHEARRTAMSNVAWDVHQVTRHRIAWDSAIADGHTGDKPPTWGVTFDTPLQTSPEPLPQMTAAEPDHAPSKTGTGQKMTTTPTQQPDALRLADELDAESTSGRVSNYTGRRAATELRCLNAEITSLTDAYCGAREDLAIWKRRALEAEEKLRSESTVSSRLVSELNAENGPTHMGEPAQKRKPLTDVEKHAMWVMATIEQCSHEQCYLRGIADSESAHGIVEKP